MLAYIRMISWVLYGKPATIPAGSRKNVVSQVDVLHLPVNGTDQQMHITAIREEQFEKANILCTIEIPWNV